MLEKAKEFLDAANNPKSMTVYGGKHGLDEKARSDRVKWLAEHLGFGAEN